MALFHEFVETKHGERRALQDTDAVVPFHLVTNLGLLRPDGVWTIGALERIIGTAEQRAALTQTTRVYVVLPRIYSAELNLAALSTLLEQYAKAQQLNIKLKYYADNSGNTTKVHFNESIEDNRLAIDIATQNIFDFLNGLGRHHAWTVLNDMHIAPGAEYQRKWHKPEIIDFPPMLKGANLMMPRNEEYDYNTVVLHSVADGQYQRVEYPLIMPTARQS